MTGCQRDECVTAVVVGDTKEDLRRVQNKEKYEENDLAELNNA